MRSLEGVVIRAAVAAASQGGEIIKWCICDSRELSSTQSHVSIIVGLGDALFKDLGISLVQVTKSTFEDNLSLFNIMLSVQEFEGATLGIGKVSQTRGLELSAEVSLESSMSLC